MIHNPDFPDVDPATGDEAETTGPTSADLRRLDVTHVTEPILDSEALVCFNGVMTNEPVHSSLADIASEPELWFASIWRYEDLAAEPTNEVTTRDTLAVVGWTLVEDSDPENGCWLISVTPECNTLLNGGNSVEVTLRFDWGHIEIVIHSESDPSNGS